MAQDDTFTIMFVCTGNTCRSSMAQALLVRMLRERLGEGAQRYRVTSAGTATLPDLPASAQAIEVLAERGIDLGEHRSTPVDPALLERADLVLTMTRRHRDTVLAMAPHLADRVFTLKEYVNPGLKGDDIDISDPFGQPVEVYRAIAAELEANLSRLVARLAERGLQ